MLICHLYIFFFDEVFVKIFGLFFNQSVYFCLSFQISLCILDYSPLSNMSFANIFSSL